MQNMREFVTISTTIFFSEIKFRSVQVTLEECPVVLFCVCVFVEMQDWCIYVLIPSYLV